MIRRQPAEALKRAAFTLMEMMVVVMILVVLAGTSVPIYLNYLENARINRVKADVRGLETAVEAYYTLHGEFPASLGTLCTPDESGKASLEESSLKDPWGQEYVYNSADMKPSGRVPWIYSTKLGKQAR